MDIAGAIGCWDTIAYIVSACIHVCAAPVLPGYATAIIYRVQGLGGSGFEEERAPL
jgi:hypothetical protein